ncbi:hypothetical protein HMI56_001414 [Coelomomyces lativittatus]|nr:hypothetical protein HMI56_001414 [Coelomomyces lativittatus]
MEEPPEWLASIATQLQTQETTTSSIRELIDHYTRLYTQYLTLSKTHKEFRDTLKLKEEEEGEEEVNVVVNAFKPKSRSSTTSGFNLQMVHSLKQDKLKLEKEVNGLHQLIQQLHMTIKEQEKLNRRIFTDLQGTQTSLRDLQTKYNDSLLLLQVKDEAIQIVQDEFTALQLELSTKEKENGLLKKENQRLTIHPPRIGVPSTYSTPSKSNEESSHPSGKKTNFHEANEMVVDQLHHLSISFKGAMKQFLETNHTHSNTTHAPLSTTESHGLSFPVSYEKEYASLMNKHKDDQVLPQSILKTWVFFFFHPFELRCETTLLFFFFFFFFF